MESEIISVPTSVKVAFCEISYTRSYLLEPILSDPNIRRKRNLETSKRTYVFFKLEYPKIT